jgi:hypothetical protein
MTMSVYIKTTKGGRISKGMIGAVTRGGGTIFINDLKNDLIVALKYDDETEAEVELLSLNEQLDAADDTALRGKRRQ